MNVKFYMPKFGRNTKFSSMAKELLLTFIATTLSIVLTFGTAHWLEMNKQKETRRLMAMTIIQDIDMSLDVVRKRLEYEKKGTDMARYLYLNINRLDSIKGDTLPIFFDYVTGIKANSELEFSKSTETIFNSSDDTWRTIDDKLFMKSVQDFYNARTTLESACKESVFFDRPVTREELSEMVMSFDDMNDPSSYAAACRRLLQSDKVSSYIGMSYMRMNTYLAFLQDYSFANETNKNLMYISESEMYAFVHQTSCKTRHASEKQLIGTWTSIKTDGRTEVQDEYRADHTFNSHLTYKFDDAAFIGSMILKVSFKGKWELQGDSLVLNFDRNSYVLTVDENGVAYSRENAEYVKQMKYDMEKGANRDAIVQQFYGTGRYAYATNIDPTGSRLDLNHPGGAIEKFQRREKEEQK